MRNRTILIVTLLLFNLSCDTISTVDLPARPQLLVMNCLAQNDGFWEVELTLSEGILGNVPFQPVLNASVSIYENDNLMETLVNTPDYEGRYFFRNSYPTPGNTYRIEATATPYPTITANFIQPRPVLIDSLALMILGASPEFENATDVILRVYITDPPGDNFYGVKSVFKSEDSPFPNYAQSLGLSFVNPAYWENSNSEYVTQTPTFTDANFNSTSTFMDFKTLISERPGDPPLEYLTVTLMNFTKEYFYYVKAANLQNSTRNDPLAQPVPVKGNIENGFGIFAGSTQTVKTQVIK